jgi:hypothetical protein
MASFIHRDSPPCVKSELDLFTIPPTQTVIEKGQFVEYHPLANIRDGGPIEFNISGSGEEYIDLAASYIHVKAKVLKADGTVLPEKESVAPVNLFLHSLFSQVDISLNERNISSASNTYPYRAYIETLLNYGEDAKKSLLTCEGFFKDEEPDKVDPTTEGVHDGLKTRYKLIERSQTVDMIGQLHCDIFQQNRLLLNLVDVKIKMVRSKPAFCLVSPTADADYKVVLDHASMFIRKVKVSPGVSLGHAKALEKSSAKYPIDRILCKTYSISPGSWSFMQDNVFLGRMPKRVIITCVENAAINGQYARNPFLFAHHNVNFLSIYVDGQSVPCKPLELNFKSDNYVRAYYSLFSSFDRDRGIYLTREEYAKGHVLYAFDLTPDLCDGSHFNLQHQGNLRLELKFSEPLTKTLSVLIYAEFQNVIEITKSRHILCDFAN